MFEWQPVAKPPPQHVSLLVRLELVGPVYDVAVFAGVQPDGERRWIMADIRLDQRLITHWARILEPDDEQI